MRLLLNNQGPVLGLGYLITIRLTRLSHQTLLCTLRIHIHACHIITSDIILLVDLKVSPSEIVNHTKDTYKRFPIAIPGRGVAAV